MGWGGEGYRVKSDPELSSVIIFGGEGKYLAEGRKRCHKGTIPNRSESPNCKIKKSFMRRHHLG
jgi:hypothetical protein